MLYFVRFLLFAALFIGGCTTSADDSNTPNLELGEMVEVRIASSTTATRTEIGEDNVSRWSLGDKIALWAQVEGGSDFTFAGETFTMRYYGSTYDNAEFAATITSMAQGTYSYFASYPIPNSVSNDTRVTYNLQTMTQNGSSGGDADIMVATPTQGIELSESTLGGAELSFKHLMHAFRIEIPEGRNNFGMDIKGLDVDFPKGVIGSVSFDVSQSDGEVIYTDGATSIHMDLEDAIGEAGEYAWVFFNPSTLTGDVTFTVYDENGYRSQEISTTVNEREFKAGEITPLTLTAPEELTDRTTITRTITANNLGEKITKVTFTAPNNGTFINRSNSWSFDVDDVPCECTIAYYPSVNGSSFDSGEITVEYESESVLSQGASIAVAGLAVQTVHTSSDVVPYLMEEYFASAPSGWSVVGYSGSSLSTSGSAMIRNYHEKEWNWSSFSNIHTDSPSRMTSTTLSTIKSGKTLSVKVSFSAKWSKNKVDMSVTVGGATGTELDDAISGGGDISLTSSSSASTKSQEVTGITRASRIAWKNKPSGEPSSGSDDVYIDDVKVSIISE
ncbi:MAG: fimbrillin family protein [Rikenellaceae bacterium]